MAGQLGFTARASQFTVTDDLDSTSSLNTFTFTIVSTSAVIYYCCFNVKIKLANRLDYDPLSTRTLLIFWSGDYIIMTTTTVHVCLPKLINWMPTINCVLSSRTCAHVTTFLCMHISFNMMISFTATWSTCMYCLLCIIIMIHCWSHFRTILKVTVLNLLIHSLVLETFGKNGGSQQISQSFIYQWFVF